MLRLGAGKKVDLSKGIIGSEWGRQRSCISRMASPFRRGKRLTEKGNLASTDTRSTALPRECSTTELQQLGRSKVRIS
jgi:hypothetical protein